MNLCFHEQLVSQINAEKMRSYYIPFSSPNFSMEKSRSALVFPLKKWKFSYFHSLPPNIEQIIPTKEFSVPFCWQRKGFDEDRYFNFFYPIPFNPPYVCKENPCGLYQTEYKINDFSGKYYIVFEGVDSCLYLYVNGEFVGYSTVSHSSAEFDLTRFLHPGSNTIRVIVFKWCSGTYLEDQDKLRMNGIFRDVYILHRSEGHLHDYKIKTDLVGQDGVIAFNADKTCELTLFYRGELIEKKLGQNVEFKIKNAHLWNAEEPNLYTLIIHCGEEYIREFIGIRKVEVDGNILKINGKPIKFKGVNRHSMTVNGYTETISDLEIDLHMFKKYNINAVRTAHYPPHPLFPVLCDLYGIYLMEEADLECHGMSTIHYYGDQGNYYKLSDNPEWLDIYLHRGRRMYERDKNRTSIIVYSLGNEAGWGNNFVEMYYDLKSKDDRPIHYEGATDPSDGHWRDKNLLDICSRMYPALEEIEKIIREGVKKPFVLCEYTHAMGNSCGDAKDYWKMIYAHEEMCGAFVWEWCNHTVQKGKKFLFGGDFGEKDYSTRYEGNFCVDGLVGTDRTIHPSLLEIAEVYAPVAVERSESGYEVVNRRDFLSLNDLECTCIIRENGDERARYILDITNVPARGRKKICSCIPVREGVTTVDFIFSHYGEYVCSTQFELGGNVSFIKSLNTIKGESFDGGFLFNSENYRALIGQDGMLQMISDKRGYECIGQPVKLLAWRVPIDNDICFAELWQGYRLAESRFSLKEMKIKDSSVKVAGWLVADIVEPILDIEIHYTFYEDRIAVKLCAEKRDWIEHIPRLGFVFNMDKRLRRLQYFGRGRGEAYEDRKLACPIGKYSAFVEDMYVPYLRPQENGSHCDTRYVTLSDEKFAFTVRNETGFSFCVSPYLPEDFQRHDFEMKKSDKIFLYVDYRMCGVGSGACGPCTQDKYLLKEKKIQFEFEIVPDLFEF